MQKNPLLGIAIVVSISLLACGSLLAQEPNALTGHTNAVSAVQYAPGGKVIATASFDRTIKLWNAATKMPIRTLEGHTGQVLALAISPNGRTLATGSRDNTVKIWDMYVPDPLQTFAGHAEAVNVIELGPKGEWVVSGGADNAVKIWQRADGTLMHDLMGHAAPLTRAAIHAEGTQIATGDAGGVIRLWNPADAAAQGVLGAHVGKVTGLAYRPGAPTLISTGEDGAVKLWQLPLVAPQTLAGHTEAVTAVAVSKDAKLIVTGGADKQVQIFDYTAAAPATRKLEGQPDAVTAIALSADNALTVSGAANGVVKLWNTADGADRLTLSGHTGPVHGVAIHPMATQLASSGEDGTIRIWRLPVAPLALAGHTLPVADVAVSPDAKLIATASADKSVRLWNAADGAAVRALAGHIEVAGSVAFRADSAQLASSDATGVIRLWNVADGAAQGELYGHTAAVTGLAYHPDGKSMVSAGEDGAVRWWQLPPVPAATLAGHADAVNAVALSKDGMLIATGTAAAKVRLFNAADGAPVREFAGQTGPVTALSLGATVLATGNDTGIVRFWNVADAADRLAVEGHVGAIHAVAFDPKGERLASAGADGTIRLWTLPVAPKAVASPAMQVAKIAYSADGKLIAAAGVANNQPTVIIRNTTDGAVVATLLGHTGAINALAFSADATKLVTGSADMTARVWNLADAKFPEIAQITNTAPVTAVAFSADAAQIFTGGADNMIKQWTVADGTEVRTIPGHTMPVTALALAGATLVSGSADMTVRLWTVATGAAVRSISHGAAVTSLAVSKDNAKIVSGGAAKFVKVWNAADGAAIASLEGHAGPISSVAFSADAARVSSCATDGIRLWNAAGPQLEVFKNAVAIQGVNFTVDNQSLAAGGVDNSLHLIQSSLAGLITGHEGAVTGLAFSADGAQLFSGGADKTVRQWTLADGKQVRTLAGPTDAVTSLAISGDGARLAAASADKNVYVWNAAAPVAPAALAADATLAHAAAIRGVHLNGDGTRLAASGDDNLVTVWDLASARPLQRFPGHAMPVTAVALSADGTKLVSGSVDKSARVWTLAATRVAVADEGKVTDLALRATANAALLATTGEDKTVKLWNYADGALLHTIPAGAAALSSVAIRGDGAQVAAASADMSVYLWTLAAQVPAAEPVKIATGALIHHLRYSTDGTRLAVGTADNHLHVYDSARNILLEDITAAAPVTSLAFVPKADAAAAVGETVVSSAANDASVHSLALLQAIAGHEGAVNSVAYAPDGTRVITGGADKTVRVWNLADGKQFASLNLEGAAPAAPFADAVTSVAVSSDGKFAAAASVDKFVRIWPLPVAAATPAAPQAVPAQTALEHAMPVRAVSLNSTGQRIATNGDDMIVRVWDLPTGRELERFAGHEAPALAVAFAGDDKTIVSGSTDKSARLWTTAATKMWIADETKVNDLALLPDGTQLATAGDEMLVKFWDLEGAMAKQLAGAQGPLARLRIRGDAAQIAAADTAGRLMLWTAADGALAQTIETGAVVNDISFSADNMKLAAAGADNYLRVFETTEGKPLHEVTGASPLLAVRFAPDKTLITGDAAKGVNTWADASPTVITSLAGHTAQVNGVVYSPDGATVASSSTDGTIRIWDLATAAQAKQLAGHEGAVYSVAFSPDGKQLVSGGIDGTARLWDVAGGTEVRKLDIAVAEGETPAPIYSVAFSPNGQLVAAAGKDQTVRLWPAAAGPAKEFEGHTDAVYLVAFSPSSARLLSCGHAGSLKIWNAADGTELFAETLPSVAYAASYASDGVSVAASCSNAATVIVDLPAAAQ